MKNREHCGTNMQLAILNFLINFNQHTSSNYQDENTETPNHKQARQFPTTTLCLTKTTCHIICNTTTPVAHYPVYTILYNRPHSTPTVCLNYLRCLLSGATIDTALEQNFWSGSQQQDRYLYHLTQCHGPHAKGKNLISVQGSQMISAVNIRMAFIAK